MKGDRVTIKDVELHLEELVIPANLLSDESLSLDETPEEEQLSPYRVDSLCTRCNKCIRISVVCTTGAIYTLEQLLLSTELSFLCAGCSRTTVRNGRRF
ncbi:E7 protein [Human papillomavirus 116]|uniref:Protein E7 n=1 Tax=Human papillomavirus 116 TaxID=915428 RepID=C7B7D3_9PAPI|nr:E7 protein [Human papillomavirus 116]ACT76413.1 E7 protein [Human papillomavirus 116]